MPAIEHPRELMPLYSQEVGCQVLKFVYILILTWFNCMICKQKVTFMKKIQQALAITAGATLL